MSRGGLDHRDPVRILALNLGHPFVLALHDLGMNHRVQLVNAVRKNNIGQPGAIDGAVFVEDVAAKAADDFVIGDSARSVKLVCEPVGLQEMCATLDHHGRNRGLAAGNASGEPYPEHEISSGGRLKCRRDCIDGHQAQGSIYGWSLGESRRLANIPYAGFTTFLQKTYRPDSPIIVRSSFAS